MIDVGWWLRGNGRNQQSVSRSFVSYRRCDGDTRAGNDAAVTQKARTRRVVIWHRGAGALTCVIGTTVGTENGIGHMNKGDYGERHCSNEPHNFDYRFCGSCTFDSAIANCVCKGPFTAIS